MLSGNPVNISSPPEPLRARTLYWKGELGKEDNQLFLSRILFLLFLLFFIVFFFVDSFPVSFCLGKGGKESGG